MVNKKSRIASKPKAEKWVNDGGSDPEVQVPSRSSVQESENPSTQTSKRLGTQAPEKLAKSKDPKYARCTVYLKNELLDRLPVSKRRTKGVKDMSDLINEAVAEWLSSRSID